MAQRFNKVLIANRGEIAVRIARGLRELGIGSVAVFSDADRRAAHVRACDEAYNIGPAPSNQSYLVVERLLEVAKRAGAGALHPGYGFLSERAHFARAVQAAGLVWIGPPADAIDAMGSKTLAREKMIAAGVPVVPGTEAIHDPHEAFAFAREAGFPVLIKAAAGGGGKGMRRVDREEDFIAAFDGARREAAAAFGDDTVYVEKFVVEPKHIEFQLLSDEHGNHLHLFERDCSMQRRHQKVIEETPCAILRDDVRRRMGEVATRAAAAVDYVGAGTVEFLLDVNQDFYFLEMNTRLQVEHPVTELVTGLDLVHWQVRVAQGEALPFTQDDLHQRGHAIQCRVYAEDPRRNFMPSPGLITHLTTPAGPGVRDDSGVTSGAEVPMHYDPMISKLVVWGEDREVAIGRMHRALSEYTVRGIQNNLEFHQIALDHPAFRQGTYDTQFIGNHLDELVAALDARIQPEDRDLADVAAAIAAFEADGPAPDAEAAPTPGADESPWRLYGRYKQLQRI